MPDRQTSTTDARNRHIEQQAQTDTELESIVPPTSPFGGLATWLRVGAVVLALALVAYAIGQGF